LEPTFLAGFTANRHAGTLDANRVPLALEVGDTLYLALASVAHGLKRSREDLALSVRLAAYLYARTFDALIE
jgi:hypothetical protein